MYSLGGVIGCKLDEPNNTTSYTVTYYTEHGTAPESIKIDEGTELSSEQLPELSVDGYDFNGWVILADSTSTSANGYKVTSDITLTASWTATTYSITFETNGGTWADSYTTTESYTVEDEIALPTSENISKTGYEFAGWFESEDLSGEATNTIAKGTTGNKTFYAKWSTGKVTYTVKHFLQNVELSDYDEQTSDTETLKGYTESQTEATAKTYEGFTAQEIAQQTIAADGSTVVEIKYDRSEITLTFDTDGGSEVASISGKYGTAVTAPTNPTKIGYTFASWSPALPSTFPSSDESYTATWTANTNTAYKVQHYQQNINDDDYTLVGTEDLTGTTDTDTSAVAKVYTGFTTKAFEQTTIAADGSTVISIYYDRNTITFTFDTDGGSEVSSISGKYGSSVTAPENPVRKHYSFNGWTPELPSSFEEDATFKAQWTQNDTGSVEGIIY